MRILTCYLSPTAGTATLDGYDIHEHPQEVRRRIGDLPEDTPLYTDMPVLDYLRLSAELQSVPPAPVDARIQEMMDVCGLGPERHKRIGEEKTVMLSSHILKEVEMTCDRILIIDQGRIVADGPTKQLREQFMAAPGSGCSRQSALHMKLLSIPKKGGKEGENVRYTFATLVERDRFIYVSPLRLVLLFRFPGTWSPRLITAQSGFRTST